MSTWRAWCGHGRIRGRACEIDHAVTGELVVVWWCWRPTGRTRSGVAPSRAAARERLAAAMRALA